MSPLLMLDSMVSRNETHSSASSFVSSMKFLSSTKTLSRFIILAFSIGSLPSSILSFAKFLSSLISVKLMFLFSSERSLMSFTKERIALLSLPRTSLRLESFIPSMLSRFIVCQSLKHFQNSLIKRLKLVNKAYTTASYLCTSISIYIT